MIWIAKIRPASNNGLGYKTKTGGFMTLPLIAQKLTGFAPNKPVFQVALVASAAVAGYLSFMPFQHKSNAIVAATAEQPQWVGHIEQPNLDVPPPGAPVTSASYLSPESVLAPKKTAAAAPKAVVSKVVLPPRRPQSPIEEISRPAEPAVISAAVMTHPDLLPPEIIPLNAEAKPRPTLLSRVADRLPAKGNLLKPFNVVGDAFHSLIKSF